MDPSAHLQTEQELQLHWQTEPFVCSQPDNHDSSLSPPPETQQTLIGDQNTLELLLHTCFNDPSAQLKFAFNNNRPNQSTKVSLVADCSTIVILYLSIWTNLENFCLGLTYFGGKGAVLQTIVHIKLLTTYWKIYA